MFLPTTLEQDYQFEFDHEFDELFFETETEARINAIHFKAHNPKGVILYFHGNAGDLSRWGNIVEYFVDLNYDVLIPDYRTYGKSKGTLSEKAFYHDASYCYKYLLNHYQEDDIILYGRSLGTGIAAYLASRHMPKQLILETPYFNIANVASKRFPLLPTKQLLKYRFPTNLYVQQVECPITIIHGTDDKVVPYESGKKLSELSLKNLKFITIQNGGHNNLIEFDSYHTAIQELLN